MKQNQSFNYGKSKLETTVSKNYDSFLPDKVKLAGNSIFLGDSSYSSRMNVVQKIITQSLYSHEDFAQYIKNVAAQAAQMAAVQEIRFNSRSYKIAKNLQLIPERVRRWLGSSGNYIDSYVCSDEFERGVVSDNRAISNIYQKMSEFVTDIGTKFGNELAEIATPSEVERFILISKIYKKMEDIATLTRENYGNELAEIATPSEVRFQGNEHRIDNSTILKYGVAIWDLTKRISNTDEGESLQQIVQRIWNVGHKEDVPNPLTLDQLRNH